MNELTPIAIRREARGDAQAIYAVNEAAFARPAEAQLVDRLRQHASPLISVVALDAHRVVGHILFSPVTLNDSESLRLGGLAPMAVLPEYQRRGIGSLLVRAGLEECRMHDMDAVFVLGHATYYPRFGFRPSSIFGVRSEYDVPDDVFMALELKSGALAGKSGVVRYHDAFRDL